MRLWRKGKKQKKERYPAQNGSTKEAWDAQNVRLEKIWHVLWSIS